MYIQCCRCHEPTWIRSLVPGLVEPSVRCQDCGHEHDLSRSSDLGETGKEQYEVANEFATRNGVGLPTAYSILLGLTTLQEAREAEAEKKEKQRKSPAPGASTPRDVAEPAAPPADDALERMQSAALEAVAQLEKAEGSEAQEPADESIELAEAAEIKQSLPVSSSAGAPARHRDPAAQKLRTPRKQKKVTIMVERDMAKERRQVTWRQGLLLGVLASLTLGLSGRHAYLTWQGLVEEGKTAQRNTQASAEAVESAEQKALAEARKKRTAVPQALQATVLRDSEDRITQVIGPNPMSVLMAYCEAYSESNTYKREALELAQAAPPTPDERFGVFRDFQRLESNWVIRISQDSTNQRWTAGNGLAPIPTREAPDQPQTIMRASLERN